MSRCVNENCNNNPFDNELEMKLATVDGDFACCQKCLKEYEKQKKEFFDNIGNDNWYNNWMDL